MSRTKIKNTIEGEPNSSGDSTGGPNVDDRTINLNTSTHGLTGFTQHLTN